MQVRDDSTVDTTAAAAALEAASVAFEAAYTNALAAFPRASDRERLDIVVTIGRVALMHEAMLSNYALTLDSPSGNAVAKACGYSSTASLLQHEHGIRKTEADTYVRLAKLLERRAYPELAEAVDAGAVSARQAIVVVRFLDRNRSRLTDEAVAKIDHAATEFATGSATNSPVKPEKLQRLIRSWLAEDDPELVELTHHEQYETRECSYVFRDDGMVDVRAILPADLAAAVIESLDANSAPRVIFVDNDDPDAEIDPRLRHQKAADAFAMAFSVAAKTRHTSKQGGAAPTLTITAKASELTKHSLGLAGVAILERTQEPVPAAVAAAVVCDGAVRAAITDETGNVLNLGRTQRLFTTDQRTAISVKYRTCQAPGCDIPSSWSEMHHVQHWNHGGPTNTDNGIPLCNFHHHQVHLDRLRITHDHATGSFVVTRSMRR